MLNQCFYYNDPQQKSNEFKYQMAMTLRVFMRYTWKSENDVAHVLGGDGLFGPIKCSIWAELDFNFLSFN